MSSVPPVVLLALRGVQILFSIVVLGTDAYVIDQLNKANDYYDGVYSFHSSRWDFLLFCAIWTFLVVPFVILAPRFLSNSSFPLPLVLVIVEAVTAIFWLSGWAACADWISSFDDYGDFGTFTGCAKAAVAFGALTWALFMATLIIDIIPLARTGARGTATTTTSAPTAGAPAGQVNTTSEMELKQDPASNQPPFVAEAPSETTHSHQTV